MFVHKRWLIEQTINCAPLRGPTAAFAARRIAITDGGPIPIPIPGPVVTGELSLIQMVARARVNP